MMRKGNAFCTTAFAAVMLGMICGACRPVKEQAMTAGGEGIEKKVISQEETDLGESLTLEEESDQEPLRSGEIQERLAALQAKNTDVCAWLEITGTDMSFPVLQSLEDTAFYLTHDIDKNADEKGCIYTEYYNHRDFGDPNTIIYGRNVDGRFAGLHRYRDRDFFETNREIKIYLEDRLLTYRIFAAYPYDSRHLIMIYDFWDREIFKTYLEDVFAQRAMDVYLDSTITVTADDKIITLSTGVKDAPEKRYLIQAVLCTE